MRLEDQVCTPEQAKILAELGVSQDANFLWIMGDEPKLIPRGDENTNDSFAAYTVAELGILLPSVVPLEDEDYYLQGTIGNRRDEFYYIWFQSSLDNVEWEEFPATEKDTEAEARAAALIWLLENDYVLAEKLSL